MGRRWGEAPYDWCARACKLMHQCTLPVIAAKKCQHGPQPHLEAHGAAAAVALRTGKAVGQSFSELEWWAMHALASSAGQIMCLCWQAAQPGPAWQLVSPWGCLQAHRQCSASTCVSGTCNNQTKVHAARHACPLPGSTRACRPSSGWPGTAAPCPPPAV